MDCLPNEPPGCDYRSLLFFSGYLYRSPRFKPLSRLLSHLSLLVYPSWSLPVPFCSAFCFSCSSLVSLFSFWSCFLPLVSFKPTKGHKNEALHGHGSVESGHQVMWRLFVFAWCQKTSLFGGCCLLLWRLPPPQWLRLYYCISVFNRLYWWTDHFRLTNSLLWSSSQTCACSDFPRNPFFYLLCTRTSAVAFLFGLLEDYPWLRIALTFLQMVLPPWSYRSRRSFVLLLPLSGS